jgi:hypothetical protein
MMFCCNAHYIHVPVLVGLNYATNLIIYSFSIDIVYL